MYDCIIIGGGPAGAAAGVYAARKKLKTALISPEFGGQSQVSEDIQNWIGTISISGSDLAKNLRAHVEAYADDVLDIIEEKVSLVEKSDGNFSVTTEKGVYTARAVLVATGSHRRKLTVPGAEEFENKGITYCASCDGPVFSGQDVVVIGGGNAGFETAAQLLAYTKSVTLLEYGKEFRADPITVNKVLANPKMKAFTNAKLTKIVGDKTVTSLTYKDTTTDTETELPIGGVFVEIGQVPTTEFVKDLVKTNDRNQIEIDPWTGRASVLGIWAAGDCTNIRYHQNNIAVGDAVKAIEDVFVFLKAA